MANASILNNNRAFATPLLLFAFDKLGMELFDMEPESVNRWLKEYNRSINPQLGQRLNAAIGLFTSDLFWTDPVTFGMVCRTLNRERALDGDSPDLFDIAWGISEANLLTQDPETGEVISTFSPAIIKYINYLIQESRLYTLPDSLSLTANPLDMPETFDDPEQQISLQERADSDAAAIDYSVVVKMAELLKQIKSLDIPLSKEASQELEKWLQMA